MAQIIVQRKVNASIDKVFASWDSEFGDIYKFHAGLKESYIMDKSPVQSGIGTIRQCNMADGKNWVREKVIEREENERLVIDIYEFSLPMKVMKGTIDFKQIGLNQTDVTFTMDFVPSMGILGKMMSPMMKMKFRPLLQAMLDSNAIYVEKGKQANPTKVIT